MTRRVTDAVRLKLNRADKHFKDLQALAGSWERTHPHSVAHSVEGKEHSHVYRLVVNEPDERVAVIIGDFVNNMRAALDYLMGGLVPANRGDLNYPIFDTDPFARDPANPRKYLQRRPHERRLWRLCTDGLASEAVGLIKELQPFASPSHGGIHMLTLLRVLSNADKHRELTVTAEGLENAQLYLNGKANKAITPGMAGVVKAGKEVHRCSTPVDVDIDGSPVIMIGAGTPKGARRAPGRAREMRLFVRGMIEWPLTPYLRRAT